MRLPSTLTLLVFFSTAAGAMPLDAPTVVSGQAPRVEGLAEAQRQIDEGDFEAAVNTLDQALSEPDLTDEQLASLYRLLGLAHLYLGNEVGARDAYEKLLQANPDHELPKSTSPKIRAIYARIKEDIKKRRVRPVTIEFQAPASTPGGAPLTFGPTIEDMALGARARVFYRRAGAQNFSSVDLVRQKGSRTAYRAVLPAFELNEEERAWELEYYIEVMDAARRRLAGKGDAFSPLTLQVLPRSAGPGVGGKEPTAWYQNPWVWVGVAAGAAAVTAGVVVIATQQQQATLPIRIQIEGLP